MPDTLIVLPDHPSEERDHHGEELAVLERVVVAPTVGVFTPAEAEQVTSEGEIVTEGQIIGIIENSGTATVVRSPFAGFLMGLLASAGERVREGEPVAWLRVVAA